MEERTRLTETTMHRRKRMMSQSRPIYAMDDELSTDSGCSSRGSSESNDRLSRRGSAERLCEGSVTHVGSGGASGCYIHCLRGHPRHSSVSRSQERLPNRNCANLHSSRSKSSRSWSPGENRVSHHDRHNRHHRRNHSGDSATHSFSPSDAHSSDSDSSKRPSKTDVIRRALQCLKIAIRQENDNESRNSGSNNNNTNCNNANKEKKQMKKSPRRILRNPVSYTYVRGLSGLPTQRVPRNTVQQVIASSACRD